MTNQFTLFTSMAFALLSGGVYIYLGWWLNKREVSAAEARLAWHAFTIWWFGLATTTLLGAFQDLLGILQITNLSLFVTISYLNILVSCIALWGLVYYLVYLFSGNSRALIPLMIFYAIYYVLLMYYYVGSAPVSVEIARWNVSLVYAHTNRGPFFIFLVALLLLPQIIGSLAYFTLYFHISDVTQKYRVVLVSWCIILWFMSPLIALAKGVAEQDWWQLTSHLISLGAALVILTAYLPPRWIKERYGVVSLNEEGQRA